MEQLKLLKQMFDEGFLSAAEYETRRIQLIDVITGTAGNIQQTTDNDSTDCSFLSHDKSMPSPLILSPLASMEETEKILLSPVPLSPNVVLPLQESQLEITMEHKLFIVKHLGALPRDVQSKVLALLQNKSPEDLVEGTLFKMLLILF
jgi:hypothetical protein